MCKVEPLHGVRSDRSFKGLSYSMGDSRYRRGSIDGCRSRLSGYFYKFSVRGPPSPLYTFYFILYTDGEGNPLILVSKGPVSEGPVPRVESMVSCAS